MATFSHFVKHNDPRVVNKIPQVFVNGKSTTLKRPCSLKIYLFSSSCSRRNRHNPLLCLIPWTVRALDSLRRGTVFFFSSTFPPPAASSSFYVRISFDRVASTLRSIRADEQPRRITFVSFALLSLLRPPTPPSCPVVVISFGLAVPVDCSISFRRSGFKVSRIDPRILLKFTLYVLFRPWKFHGVWGEGGERDRQTFSSRNFLWFRVGRF